MPASFALFSVLFYPPQAKSCVTHLSEWETDGQAVTLPQSFSGLPARTPLTLTKQLTLPLKTGNCLYIKAVYTPVRIYADDVLLYTYGETGSYPAFLLDPPTCSMILPLPDEKNTLTLRLEYLSPSQRSTAALSPLMTGSYHDILSVLFREMGFSVLFSFVLIVLGIFLCPLSLSLLRFKDAGAPFFWLGLFSFLVGMWIFGECNLTCVLVDHPTLLYLMAFSGLFTFPIPLIKFGCTLFDLQNNTLLNRLCLILEFSVSTAVLLQIAGLVSLSKTMYLFHILNPLALCIFGGTLFHLRHTSTSIRRFLLPAAILALCSLLEVGNYYLFRLPVQKFFFFQAGALIFIIHSGILCGYFVRDSLNLRIRNQQLADKLSLMEQQLKLQKERHQLLSQTSAQLRQQRHDLKHHLAVIREFLSNHEAERLMAYLDELSAHIPEEPLCRLCENDAVNAVAVHYQSMAHKLGITDCSILLPIPQDTGNVPESDICVIVGNLLENAVAAAQNTEHPFIHMRGRFTDGILTITMDNSFLTDKMPDKSFHSPKPDGGIGLASIQSVTEKHGGASRFQAENGVFFSSVYLYLL